MNPRYPEGSPEYEDYAVALRVELEKFAAGEHPYEFEEIWESGAEEAARRDWEESQYAEAAAFEDQRAFETWADDRIADDEDADVSEAAYVTYLEGFFPDD